VLQTKALAITLERKLFERGYAVYALDGDNVRMGVHACLGFSLGSARKYSPRREIAAHFADAISCAYLVHFTACLPMRGGGFAFP
jgi:adenylylsulfate kinase-like enzyme